MDPALGSKARIAAYMTLWYIFNIVFNIVNKLTLNAIPMPWLIAIWQLAASSLFMCFLWFTNLHKRPELPRGFWKSLLPVAFFHTIGHVSACLCVSKMAVSFVHVIKV
jgi:solute carrier family 35 protein E1